jgi:hypothetical protein
MRSGEDDSATETDAYNVVDEDDRQIADGIEQIYHFRNPLYNTEIWFVALGSDNASHDGAKAFIAEHADGGRNAIFRIAEHGRQNSPFQFNTGGLCLVLQNRRLHIGRRLLVVARSRHVISRGQRRP